MNIQTCMKSAPLIDQYYYTVVSPIFVCTIKACSQRAKANAKAKKIKEQSEEIKEISGKHQRKISLSRSLSLGVGRPLASDSDISLRFRFGHQR